MCISVSQETNLTFFMWMEVLYDFMRKHMYILEKTNVA